eukprot:6335353-Amphidinium_carterae.2
MGSTRDLKSACLGTRPYPAYVFELHKLLNVRGNIRQPWAPAQHFLRFLLREKSSISPRESRNLPDPWMLSHVFTDGEGNRTGRFTCPA